MNTEAEEVALLRRLMGDREWRLDNFYQILDEEAGIVPFKARAEQLQFRRQRHYRNFVPKARKLGISTEIVIENLDACLFSANLTVGIIDLKEGDAQAKLQIARTAWEAGPSHANPHIGRLWQALHEACPLLSDNGGTMAWKNGSSMEAGTSFTGRTPQRMHISEYGPIAAQKPNKAAQIQRGSINAVPPTGIVDIETTMEGGRVGLCYKYFKLALAACGEERLTPADYRLHFFSWLGHPSYALPGCRPARGEALDYFRRLEAEHGITVPLERQAWWERRFLELGEEIFQQYPTVIEECDRAVVAGAIYPQMTALRSQGRVRDFEPEPGLPIFTFWDLGSGDNSAGWLIQPGPRDINVLGWAAGEGMGAPGMAGVIRGWERDFGVLAGHYLPHDANITDKGSGITYLRQLQQAGIPSNLITVVPRTPRVWAGIGEVRKLLHRVWFHSRCDVAPLSVDGDELPSGVARMEGYRKIPRATGVTASEPLPDICSHTADAFRTFAEASAQHLISARTGWEPGGAGARITVKRAGQWS